MVGRSSSEVKAMVHTAYNMLWLKNQFSDLVYWANWNPLATNQYHALLQRILSATQVFMEGLRSKYIEAICPFIRLAIMNQHIITPLYTFSEQIVEVFNKALGERQFAPFVITRALLKFVLPLEGINWCSVTINAYTN